MNYYKSDKHEGVFVLARLWPGKYLGGPRWRATNIYTGKTIKLNESELNDFKVAYTR